ncbi:MAG TPA: TonB family protein, partial [Ignavibacteriaceae bacterium]|nr:TonB family protein [Ignavibacteriaceae bacterium]
ILFFIFSGSSESDKNVNVASTQLPAVNINIEQQKGEEVISESFIEETQIEETPQLETTQKTDIKTESRTKTKPENKLTVPPLPESPKIIETNDLSSINVDETNKNKVTSEGAIKDIPITPIAQMKKPEEENSYFVAVEEMPEPIGGIAVIQKKVVYPAIASAAAIEGRVIINAYVDIYGNVTKTEVVKGIGYGCDEAAVDAISSTKFKPGKQRGKPVNVRITIPILFKRM